MAQLTVELPSIESDYGGFARLVEVADRLKECVFDDIAVDMQYTSWIDANMCATLGAILYAAGDNLNTVTVTNVKRSVEAILSKNGFLSNYGRQAQRDTYGTTIAYRRFEPKDDRFFASYVERHLVGKGIPAMTAALRKKFRESIFEIFNNAVIHSRTKLGIFSCGQFFPRKERLDFAVADLGVGIRQNVRRRLGLNLTAEQAIKWAVEGKNTTKTGPVPGGLGLKLLREFITQNGGRIQIVSDKGYWELSMGRIETRSFRHSFRGTVVNLEINTADTKTYRLTSELKPDDIF